MEGVTSISTISLVDVDVESFSSYIYQPTPWAKHTKTTVWGAPGLGNPSCSKLDFLILLSPSPSPSPLACPSPTLPLVLDLVELRTTPAAAVGAVCRLSVLYNRLPIHGQGSRGVLLREAPSSCPNRARQRCSSPADGLMVSTSTEHHLALRLVRSSMPSPP